LLPDYTKSNGMVGDACRAKMGL